MADTSSAGAITVSKRQDCRPIDRESARALCEAGYLPLPQYLAMCREHGWT